MTWDAFHRREAVTQAAMELAEQRRDGALAWAELPEAEAAFGSQERLLQALQMRWHTRLAGAIEHELTKEPVDLEAGVVHAWRRCAARMPGLRALLDAHAGPAAGPDAGIDTGPLRTARRKEWMLLASASGVAALDDPAAATLGERIERRARSVVVDTAQPTIKHPAHRGNSLLRRIRHALAA